IIFFFQAEDGIRDFHVTGVQTCALPICPAWGLVHPAALDADESVLDDVDAADAVAPGDLVGPSKELVRFELLVVDGDGVAVLERSEERRVGKECRSRWSPCQ